MCDVIAEAQLKMRELWAKEGACSRSWRLDWNCPYF